MSRKASSKAGVFLIIVGFALIVGLGYLGFNFSSVINEPFRTVERLNPQDYLDRANNLVGNTYRVTGEIEHLLSFDDDGKRVFSILTKYGHRDFVIPVLLGDHFAGDSFQRGQKVTFKLAVRSSGLLEALEWKR